MTTSPTDPWIEFRATFGVQYAREQHPHWAAARPDGWLTVLAVDEQTAREVLRHAIGGAYASIYHPDDVKSYPTLELRPDHGGAPYYPDGQLGSLQAFRGPAGEPMWRWLRTSHGAWEGPVDDTVLHAASAPAPAEPEIGEHERGLIDLVEMAGPGGAPMAAWALGEIRALRARVATLEGRTGG